MRCKVSSILWEGAPAVLGLIEDITNSIESENRLKKLVEELKRSNRFMIGRENRLLELKQEVNTLCEEMGKPKRYKAPDLKKV